MRQMNAPVNQPMLLTQDSEDILGQFYFAFGQGAGTMRVQRAAIAALRARYLPNIKAASLDWTDVAGNVLSLLQQVGRLAALLATQSGRTAISEADFNAARTTLEGNVHRQKEEAGLMAGPFCLAPAGAAYTELPAAERAMAELPLTDPARSEPGLAPTVN